MAAAAEAGRGPLFAPFRALGYITEDVPFAVQRRGKETYVAVSVGRTWQIYNTAKLTLVMVGPQLPRSVSALAVKGDLTFAAAGAAIHEAKRNHSTGVYAGHAGAILQLLVLGDQLLSLGEDRQLLVWRIGQHEQPQAALDLGAAGLQPSCMVHPDTYINKLLIGCADGRLALVNFISGQVIHTFNGWGSPVRCLASSPALDVVGVGLADGRVVLHNLRFDSEVCTLHNAAAAGAAASRFLTGSDAAVAAAATSAAVTCLSFRTGAGLPLLAAGGSAGVIALWNLEQRCLHHVVRDAHDQSLLALHFFAGEPRLMSSAADNSIKQWVLDGQDATPRLLKFRSGHSAPPSVVRHYADGLRLLSAGADRSFRMFSTIQDQQSRELAQHKAARRAKRARVTEHDIKLPRVTQLAAAEARERDWANVVTCHAGDPAAYTWRLAHFTLGEHVLLPPADEPQAPGGSGAGAPQQRPAATAVAVSCCGNFGLVGSAGGRVDRYNLQSGLHRGCYCRQAPGAPAVVDGVPQPPALLPAHTGAVVGVGSDATNALLVTVGADAALRSWDFRRLRLAAELPLGSPATLLALHAGSDLAAVGCADRVVRVVDIQAARVVRRFSGHSDRLTDLAISSDCRWLLTTAMDATLRVFDIPASQCLQVMHLGTPVTSLSLSAGQDLLATCHVNKRGVFLWSNQLMFGDTAAVAAYTERPVPVRLPSIAADAAAAARERGADAAAGGAGKQGRVGVVKGSNQRRRGGAGSDGSGSDSEQEEEEQEEEDDAGEAGGGLNAAALLHAGRQARLLVDGGALSDSSSDFYEASSSTSSDEDSGSSDGEGEAGSSSSSDDDEAAGSDAAAAAQHRSASRLKRRRRAAQRAQAAAAAEAAEAVAKAAYRQTDASGAPAPLAPSLATLSLLPRSQWENLLHLDTIKARSKPLQPPKKPEAAPFFLPTVPGLAGQPTFAPGAADGAEPDGAEADGDAAAAGGGGGGHSRVLRGRGGSLAAAPSAFVALLRGCAGAGDFTSFMAHVRGLSPAALDRELRGMAVLEAGEGERARELADVGLLLDALHAELDASRNFELVQALLARVLVIHGDSLTAHAPLLAAAERLQRKLRPTWLRLDGLLSNVRCMVDFVGHAQA